jgi:hypothetical protein
MNTEKQLQLVNKEQAKKLREAGFNWDTYNYNYSAENIDHLETSNYLANWNSGKLFISVPTVALALQWFRVVKGIQNGVIFFESKNRILYYGKYQNTGLGITEKVTQSFDAYPPTESALLDELLEKIKKPA